MEVIKRLCSESEADSEHTYFYYYKCPNCGTNLGTSLDKEKYEKCPICRKEIEY